MMMRAIEALHGVHVALIISPAGIGSTGGVDVTASALIDVVPGSSLPQAVAVNRGWPCDTHATLAAHGLNALYELDYAIGQAYQQKVLFE
jgi:hypothetical protein